MRATSPALKRLRRTFEVDRSKPVAVLQLRLNTVDEAARSVTTMRTIWWSSRAVVTLRGPVSACLCVRPPSLHWFHIRITVVAGCLVRASMSRYDKPASRRLTILTRSNASTRHTCTSFQFSTLFGSCALTEQGITLTFLVTQEMSLLGLCVRYLSGIVVNYFWYTGLHIFQVWASLQPFCLGVTLFTNSSVLILLSLSLLDYSLSTLTNVGLTPRGTYNPNVRA